MICSQTRQKIGQSYHVIHSASFDKIEQIPIVSGELIAFILQILAQTAIWSCLMSKILKISKNFKKFKEFKKGLSIFLQKTLKAMIFLFIDLNGC